MFVCVIPSPSLLSSVPPVSFRREVTALSVMSVCFHIDRPFCQKQDLDACFRWGKRGIQMARRKSEEGEGKNTHNRAAGGNAEATDDFMQRGKDFFPLDWVRRSEMRVSPWALSRSFPAALILAQEAVEVQEQRSQAASLLVYAFSNSRSSWLKPGLEDFQKLEHTLVVSNFAEVQRPSKNQPPALTWHLN